MLIQWRKKVGNKGGSKDWRMRKEERTEEERSKEDRERRGDGGRKEENK